MGSEQADVLHSLFGRKVVRISESLVVKPGPNLRAHEAETLRFVAANTTIPIPKVHDVHYEDGRPQRRLYRGVGRGKAIIGQHSVIEGGPFESEQMFNEFILADIVRAAPDLLRHYAKHALQDTHEIVFTHSDFAPRNILVDENGKVTAVLDSEDYLPHILPRGVFLSSYSTTLENV
ncbi:hypothetical protein BDW59DRAFT_157998 [Aspergillus cavernicola]|uniref:Aminoglycoside phosphotransferase domain-containing protein n=1 Tax=Aspergillus cavernicola TaxID=176166 RepID=A0ABR4IUZ7_9EURO